MRCEFVAGKTGNITDGEHGVAAGGWLSILDPEGTNTITSTSASTITSTSTATSAITSTSFVTSAIASTNASACISISLP